MLSAQVKTYLPKIRSYLSTQPILKAWIFGSCSRGEETNESDLDLLVTYAPEARVSLLDICRIAIGLEDQIGRKIDLIEANSLLPFAIPSANRDKILIYERAT